MQEFITTIATDLAPATVVGNAILALALIPAQYLVDIGKDRIRAFVDKVKPHEPEKVYYEAFMRALQEHGERHDYTAKRLTTKLRRRLKKEKSQFYNCVNTLRIPETLIKPSEPFPAQVFAEKLAKEFNLDLSQTECELVCAVLRDCMGYYRKNLYRLMDEKGLLLQTIQIVMDLQDRTVLFETMLSNTATKSDILLLKDALLTAIRREDNNWQDKTLKEYDQMINGQYRYIEFTAGFSPRINARDIRMKMSDVFINLEFANHGPANSGLTKKQDFDLETAVLYNRFNVFLGDPGCGKTTLLKKIAFDLSTSKNRSGGTLSNFVPLYFRLAEYSRFYQKTRKSLAEYLQQTFYQHKTALFDTALRDRSLVFLMDGLDEISDTPLRIQVVDQVNTFVFANPQFIYFITSRIVGYQDAALNGIFSTYRLQPLSDAKIKAFIRQWHLAVEQNTDDGKSDEEKRASAEKHTDSLVSAIEKNSSVKRLATNPLLLTIITLIHLQGGRLPNKRVELYEICAETFLQHWINRRVESVDAILDRDILIELLSRIAFYIHENYANGLIPEDDFQQKFLQYYRELSGDQVRTLPELKKECRSFIDFIRQETGIFAEKGQDERGRNLFGFLHLTFEEYFAAIEFKRRVTQNAIMLKDYIPSARWQEIILLCAALFGGQSGSGRYEASRFVRKILKAHEIFPPMHQNLRLGLYIMADDVRFEQDCEKDIWQQLRNVMKTDSDFDLYEEMEALNTSVVYKEPLRIKMDQWLKGDDLLFANSVKVLLHLCYDPTWHDLVAAIPNRPNYHCLLDHFDFGLRFLTNIGQQEEIYQRWVEGIISYLNARPAYNKTKWSLLCFLSDFRFQLNRDFVKDLIHPKDQNALCTLNFANELFTPFGKENVVEALKQCLSKISFPSVPSPRIVVRHEMPDLEKISLSSARFRPCVQTDQDDLTYHIMINECEQTVSHQNIYQYIIFDAFLEEVQIGTYAEPLTLAAFTEVFGIRERGIDMDDLWQILTSVGLSTPDITEVLDNWEKGYFDFQRNPLKAHFSTQEEEDTCFSEIRQWARSRGREFPVQQLMAQMFLTQYDSERNYVTRKSLQNAVNFYTNSHIRKGERHNAYEIIKHAVLTMTPRHSSGATGKKAGV